jgi:hypothetical protein
VLLALVVALACALLLLAAPARAAESQSMAMAGKSIAGAISDIMKMAQSNGKETDSTVKERTQAQADAEVKGEEVRVLFVVVARLGDATKTVPVSSILLNLSTNVHPSASPSHTPANRTPLARP